MSLSRRLAAVLGSVALVLFYVAHFEGSPQLVETNAVSVEDTSGPGAPAVLFERQAEPDAVYVVANGSPDETGRMAATRVDARNGTRAAARIPIGPGSDYLPLLSAAVTGYPRVEFRGLHLRRPTFYLFSFPDGRGPGFYLVDSHTGLVRVVTSGPSSRVLLSRAVVNSSAVSEMKSYLWAGASRRLVALFQRRPTGWTLSLLFVPETAVAWFRGEDL